MKREIKLIRGNAHNEIISLLFLDFKSLQRLKRFSQKDLMAICEVNKELLFWLQALLRCMCSTHIYV